MLGGSADNAAKAAANPSLDTRTVYGQSRGGQDLTAYRVGSGGPAVLYVAAQDGAMRSPPTCSNVCMSTSSTIP